MKKCDCGIDGELEIICEGCRPVKMVVHNLKVGKKIGKFETCCKNEKSVKDGKVSTRCVQKNMEVEPREERLPSEFTGRKVRL